MEVFAIVSIPTIAVERVVRYAYLIFIALSFAGVAAWDLRYGSRLLKRAGTWFAILGTAVFLLLADIIGIRLGIFATNPNYVSGVFLGSPDLPLEEPLLLAFIAYFSLVLGTLKKNA